MAGCPDPHWKQRIDEALRVARAHGCVPICADGHGALDLHIAKSGAFYWKCAAPDCPSYEWHREYSDMKCPRCGEHMEKVPSKKVKGGNFLKCGNRKSHADDVVMFRNRDNGEWEEPHQRRNDEVVRTRRTVGRAAVLGRPVFPEEKRIAAMQVLSAVARLNGLPGHHAEVLRNMATIIAELKTLSWSEEELHGFTDLLIDSDFLRYVPAADALVLTGYGAGYLTKEARSQEHHPSDGEEPLGPRHTP